MNEKEIDRLTRGLMQDTAEQPSSMLNARIMGLIMQEKKRLQKYYIRKQLSPAGIFALFITYMVLISALMMGSTMLKGEPSVLLEGLKNYFPALLTISSGISCFFLFTQLDYWMKRRAS